MAGDTTPPVDTTTALLDHARTLARARARWDAARTEAAALAAAAAAEGMPETQIARCLGVDRLTVRSWLGKPRRR